MDDHERGAAASEAPAKLRPWTKDDLEALRLGHVALSDIAADAEDGGDDEDAEHFYKMSDLLWRIRTAPEARSEAVELRGGVQNIAAERERQVEAEGWDAEHDDGHTTGDLAAAASCYANRAALQARGFSKTSYDPRLTLPDIWPWGRELWKPSDDPIRNLEKAGALIAAEIDRLLRLDAVKDGQDTRGGSSIIRAGDHTSPVAGETPARPDPAPESEGEVG